VLVTALDAGSGSGRTRIRATPTWSRIGENHYGSKFTARPLEMPIRRWNSPHARHIGSRGTRHVSLTGSGPSVLRWRKVPAGLPAARLSQVIQEAYNSGPSSGALRFRVSRRRPWLARASLVIATLRWQLWQRPRRRPGSQNSMFGDRPATKSDDGAPLSHSMFPARRSQALA